MQEPGAPPPTEPGLAPPAGAAPSTFDTEAPMATTGGDGDSEFSFTRNAFTVNMLGKQISGKNAQHLITGLGGLVCLFMASFIYVGFFEGVDPETDEQLEPICENHSFTRGECEATGCCEFDDGRCWPGQPSEDPGVSRLQLCHPAVFPARCSFSRPVEDGGLLVSDEIFCDPPERSRPSDRLRAAQAAAGTGTAPATPSPSSATPSPTVRAQAIPSTT